MSKTAKPAPPLERAPKGYGIRNLRETLIVAESTRRSMQGNRSEGTKPEINFRKALWDAGLRGYRKNAKRLPGTPDVVYGRAKLAVFVHGCFWHGCPKCTRNRSPKTNALYWSTKVETNRERDERQKAALEAMGYRVLELWECEVAPRVVGEAVERVRAALAE